MRELIDRVLSAIMTAIGCKHGSCVSNGGNHVHKNCHRTGGRRSGGTGFGPYSCSRDGSRISGRPMAYAVMCRPLSHWKPAIRFFPACYVYIVWRANGSVDRRRRGARADDATTSHAVFDGTIHDTGRAPGPGSRQTSSSKPLPSHRMPTMHGSLPHMGHGSIFTPRPNRASVCLTRCLPYGYRSMACDGMPGRLRHDRLYQRTLSCSSSRRVTTGNGMLPHPPCNVPSCAIF